MTGRFFSRCAQSSVTRVRLFEETLPSATSFRDGSPPRSLPPRRSRTPRRARARSSPRPFEDRLSYRDRRAIPNRCARRRRSRAGAWRDRT
jgi:hypothetical protein